MVENIFCIGNGESRIGYDLDKLKPYGKIYGCNAMYRDYTPDVLCAVDMGIMHEIYNSGYAQNNSCVFRDWNRILVKCTNNYYGQDNNIQTKIMN